MNATAIPCLPENAPFTPEQRAWVNGFLAGLFAPAGPLAAPAAGPAPAAPARRSLRIAFGSQTGTAEGIARRLAREAERRGYSASVQELNAVSLETLQEPTPFILVTSTWGDGDAPENAAGFWTRIESESAPRLESLRFAVLGLGDRNYPEFCGAARKFDERLAAQGGRRLLSRTDCDVDYEKAATSWIESLWPALEAGESKPPVVERVPAEVTPTPAPSSAAGTFNRNHPFPARLKTNRRLNRTGSSKDTRHLEILLGDSGLQYEPGDALGVLPQNASALVEEVLALLGCEGGESVELDGAGVLTLHEALIRRCSITAPTPAFLREVAARSGHSELTALLEPSRKADLDPWLYGRDVVDVLRACPGARIPPQELVNSLRRLPPRLYSISSSPRAHPGEVHLTVGTVRYEAHGRMHHGVCSCWLADRVVPGETPVPVFVQTSHGFRLPADPDRPILMIGPGTGIAPFRAFLEERQVTGARGRNWLFFGDQQRATDFLYEEEISAWARDGLLTRLDLAFSRDQAEKIYVQSRMLEHAAELWSWLESGAHVYVCGDARRMARDVDEALHQVIVTAGGRSREQAAEYVAALKSAKRYQRDVY